MNNYKDKRKSEMMMLVLVLFTVLCGLTLVFFGKQVSAPMPAHAVDINQATADQLAQALPVTQTSARKLIEERRKLRGHRWPDVYQFKRSHVFKGQSSIVIGRRFIARTAAEAASKFWLGVFFYLLAFSVAHLCMRRLAPQADPFLLPLTAFLSGLGLILVYSVSDPLRDTFAYIGQIWGVAFYGVIALLLPLTKPFSRLPLRRYQYSYVVLAVLLMIAMKMFGRGPGGVPITLAGVEPVEIIKLLLMLFIVSYLTERHGLKDRSRPLPPPRDFFPLAVIYGFALLLFMLVKDLGPAVLLFGVFLTLIYLTTQKAFYPALGTLLLLSAAVVADKAHFGFFATRVTMWSSPWNNNNPNGAQLAEGIWGMATGGLGGSGLGLGQPQLMPRAGSDLIFATLGEQLGLVGTLGVLLLYVLLLKRGMQIALQAGTEFDRLLAAGISVLLGLQIMIITGGVTGLVPLTGMTLPFISYGASSLVIDFFMIGLLLSVSNKSLDDTVAERAPREWHGAARVLSTVFLVYIVAGIGGYKLLLFQGLQNKYYATRLLYSPDADGVSRPHINPRLLMYAKAIPRGQILDRNNVVLARTAQSGEVGATSLLTPDGTPRIYAGGSSCAQLLMAVEGTEGPLARNSVLRGFNHYADLLAFYRRYGIVRSNAHAPIGSEARNVHLSIDIGLQETAFEALKRYGFTGRGAAVALDAATGQVLAAVSLPSFNPSTITPQRWMWIHTNSDVSHTLMFRPIQGLYPPGSVFKIITATAGLEHGLGGFIFDAPHADTVHWQFDGHEYSRRVTDEAGFPPFGITDMAKAIRVSCNVYFAHLGVAMGARVLENTARERFKLAHMPPLALLGPALPDCAYGQGPILTTPMEIANAAQAVANDGQFLPPAFFLPPAGAEAVTPTDAMNPMQAQQLQTMLAAVTTDGTAAGVFNNLPVSVAGKTGSAQNNQGDKVSHSWFAGFAPATRPTLAFACIIENGGAGRSAAAPVCREIIRKALGG